MSYYTGCIYAKKTNTDENIILDFYTIQVNISVVNKWFKFCVTNKSNSTTRDRVFRITDVNTDIIYLKDLVVSTKPCFKIPKFNIQEKAYPVEIGKDIVITRPINKIDNFSKEAKYKQTYLNIINKKTFYINNVCYDNNGNSISGGNKSLAPFAGLKYAKLYFYDDNDILIVEIRRGATNVYPEYKVIHSSGPTVTALNEHGVLDVSGFKDTIYEYVEIPTKFSYKKHGPTLTKSNSGDIITPTDLTLSDKGYKIYDVDLNKEKIWTGSKWVDATGADV